MATAPLSASWRELLRGEHALSAAVVVLGLLAPALNAFITATMLPSIVREIGGLPFYAWATTAYAVTSILGTGGYPTLGRRLGTRGAMITAGAIFVAGTGTCAAAASMPVLVAGRAVQGLGGGFLIAGVYAVVRELFPVRLWPRAFASISATWGAAALAGPAVGGVFARLGAWRTGFWSMVPIVVLAVVLSSYLLRRSARRRSPASRIPLGRLGLVCGAALCIASVANTRWPALQAALIIAAVAAIGLMVRLDARAPVRLFPSDMLALGHPLGKAFCIVFLLALTTTPVGVFISLLLQVLHGVSPAVAGYIHAAQSMAWTTATVVGARLSEAQVRRAIVLGPLLVTTGFVGLTWTIAAGPVAAIAASVILVGSGIGTCWAHLSNVVMASGRPDEDAVTASLIPSTQQFAIAFGAALSGVVAGATGLTGSATPEVAALTGTVLYGGFIAAPLVALAIATRLHPPVAIQTAESKS